MVKHIEYDITNPLRLAALIEFVNKHWMDALNDKKPLRVIVVDSEAKRNAATEILRKARIGHAVGVLVVWRGYEGSCRM